MNHQRLAFFELLLFWEGSCSTSQLEHQFNISREHIRKDIKFYIKHHPQNLSTQRSPFKPSHCFTPMYSKVSQTTYFNWIETRNYVETNNDQPAWQWQTPRITSHLTPNLLRPIINALRHKQRIDIDYYSMAQAHNQDGRVIQPHTLFRASNLFYLRAFCEKNGDFRDFLLTRIRGIPEVLDSATKFAFDDKAWSAQVKIIIAPDSRLDKAKQALLAHDYGMTNHQLELVVPGAMVKYTLKDLGIDPKIIEAKPEAQQLIIVNLDDIQPWIF